MRACDLSHGKILPGAHAAATTEKSPGNDRERGQTVLAGDDAPHDRQTDDLSA
jgi:hypothetical protein